MAALYALPSLAAELQESPAGEEAKQGLPQLDVTQFPAQLFWLAVTFGILYVMMAFVALPRVKRTQGNRRAMIDGELAAARSASTDAKAMMARADKALADARGNALASMNDIKARATLAATEQQDKQQKDIAQRLGTAEATIAAARAAAITEIEASAGDLARAIVEKLTGRPAAAADR